MLENVCSDRMNLGTSQVRTYGKPAVGGPFSLVDEDGRPVTDASYPGKYLLIYFGFTYCPDICPSELVKIGKVLQKLGNSDPVCFAFFDSNAAHNVIILLYH